MLCTAQPHAESQSVAYTPPCTDPIGLWWYSAGVTSKTTLPGSTDTQPKPRVAAIGGGGSRPAIISVKNEIPSSSRAAAADGAGSAHSYVRRLPSAAAAPYPGSADAGELLTVP